MKFAAKKNKRGSTPLFFMYSTIRRTPRPSAPARVLFGTSPRRSHRRLLSYLIVRLFFRCPARFQSLVFPYLLFLSFALCRLPEIPYYKYTPNKCSMSTKCRFLPNFYF